MKKTILRYRADNDKINSVEKTNSGIYIRNLSTTYVGYLVDAQYTRFLCCKTPST